MKLAGYYMTFKGDEWLNAVDKKTTPVITMHTACAWNTFSLQDSDLETLVYIPVEQAQGLLCDHCRHPLTEPQLYAFQPGYFERFEVERLYRDIVGDRGQDAMIMQDKQTGDYFVRVAGTFRIKNWQEWLVYKESHL